MMRRRGADFCIRTFPSLLMGCVFSCNSELPGTRFSRVFCAEAVIIDVTLLLYLGRTLTLPPYLQNLQHLPLSKHFDAILAGRGAVITPPTYQGFRCLNLSRKHGGVACLMRFFHITKVEMSGLIHPFLSMVLFCCDKEWENCPDQKCLQKKSFISSCFENIFIKNIDLIAVPRYAYIRNSLARLCFHRSVAQRSVASRWVCKLFQNHVQLFEGLLTLDFIDGER